MITFFVIGILIGAALVCIALALFTDDAAAASGVIEEGQVW